jgi:ATP-binding cassette subfamily C protein CydC
MKSTFGRVLQLARPVKWSMLLATLLGFATVGCGVGLMATSGYLISAAALHPSIAALTIAIVSVRFFGLARGGFRYVERLVSHGATFRLLAKIRVWLYQALEPLAPARLMEYAHSQGTGFRSGDLLSRIVSDIETLQNIYIRVLAPPMVAALVAASVWWFMGAYAPLLAWTFLAFFLASSVIVPLLAHLLGHRIGQQLVRVKAELNAQVVDGIQGMADSVAFGNEQRQETRMHQLADTLTQLQMRMANVSGFQGMLSSLFSNLAAWTMLVLAIPLMRASQINGVLLAMLVLTVMASFEAVMPLPAAFQQLGGALEAARRLFEIVDAHPAVHDVEQPLALPQHYDIRVHHLSFRYYDNEPLVLDDVSFDVPQGQRIAIVGESGAGKSTLAHLLLRFWDYQQGKILLAGHDLRQYRQDDIHKLISVVSQDTHLFNTTIRENLRIARSGASDEELIEAAQKAQIHDFIQSLPNGYDTRIGEQGLLLSGGERQRLAIARAILKNAPILILDEATANLDALTEREVLRSLHILMQGRTTIMITHRLIDLDTVDEILVLRSGRVIEHGTHSDLIQAEGCYWTMWNRQHHLLV